LRDIDPARWRPEPLLALAACALLLAAYFVSAALWGRIVVDLGGPRLPVFESIRLFMIANLGRYLPGKVWQIAGLTVLSRRRGIPAATATAAAVLGQGFALVGATLVGTGALLAGPPEVRRWGLVGAAGLVVAVAVGLVPAVFDRLIALWFRLARQDQPPHLGAGHALGWLVAFTANWVLYAFSFQVLAASFGHAGDPIAVASAFAAAYVLGYLMIFAPAGMGVREGALVVLLTPRMGASSATVLAVMSRLWTTGVELLPAGAFWLRHMASGSSDASANDSWAGDSGVSDSGATEGPGE